MGSLQLKFDFVYYNERLSIKSDIAVNFGNLRMIIETEVHKMRHVK